MTHVAEKGTKFFARFEKVSSHLDIDSRLLPRLSNRDIVDIYGASGSGKTELLYHLLVQCVLPDTPWKGCALGGLNRRVLFVDNDLRFDLFRVVRILEKRVRAQLRKSAVAGKQDSTPQPGELSAFLNSRLELLDVLRCPDFDTFICSLKSLEVRRGDAPFVLMVDGVTSFYWSMRLRGGGAAERGAESVAAVAATVRGLSRAHAVPVVATRRKLVRAAAFERTRLVAPWRQVVTRELEVAFSGSAPGSSAVTVHDLGRNRKFGGVITDAGFGLTG